MSKGVGGSEDQLCDSSPVPSTSNLDSSFSSQASADSGDVFLPKRVCTSFPSDSSIQIPKNIMKKMGPLADHRVGVSNMQLTAGLLNHSGGDVDSISLSESTTRRSRATAREVGAAKVKENFSCKNGQINFDGKLLINFGGFGKVNRLAAQEKDNQLLCVTKTDDSTGKTEAEGKALEDWELKESIIACGFDTTSSNTGIHMGSCVILQDILQRQQTFDVLSQFTHAQNGIFQYFMCLRILGVVKGQGVVVDILDQE